MNTKPKLTLHTDIVVTALILVREQTVIPAQSAVTTFLRQKIILMLFFSFFFLYAYISILNRCYMEVSPPLCLQHSCPARKETLKPVFSNYK